MIIYKDSAKREQSAELVPELCQDAAYLIQR